MTHTPTPRCNDRVVRCNRSRGSHVGRSAGRQPGPSEGSRLGALHLLWALPVALVAAVAVTVVAGFAACGVSGCSGGGFGPEGGRPLVAAVLVLVAGGVLATPVLLAGWSRRSSVRLGAAVVVAAGWAVWAWLTVTGAL